MQQLPGNPGSLAAYDGDGRIRRAVDARLTLTPRA